MGVVSRIPFVLLPPSEAKSIGGVTGSRRGAFDEALGPRRAELVEALAETLGAPGALERLTGAHGARLERAASALAQLVDGSAPVLPTWRRYDGVVWRHLDAASIPSARRRRLLVPSALYGITAGDDPIADYRLTFHAHVAGVDRLADYWRDTLTDAVVELTGRVPLVDLLPHEHRRALDLDRLAVRTRVITVRFEESRGRRAADHSAKAAKGALARHLLLGGVEEIGAFAWERWRCVAADDFSAVVRTVR